MIISEVKIKAERSSFKIKVESRLRNLKEWHK